MNCTTCNTPLEANARFCPKCGTPVSQMTRNSAAPSFANANANEPPTIPPTPSPFQQAPSNQSYAPTAQSWSQSPQQPPFTPSAQSQQPIQPIQPLQPIQSVQYTPPQQQQYLSNDRGGAKAGTFTGTEEPPRRRRRRGCLPGFLITLAAVLIIVVGGWFLVARPFLSNMAQTKINDALTSAVNNIPGTVAVLPAGQVPISETVLNNLLVLNSSPNDLVKNMKIRITSTEMRLEFQVFGFSCAVTGVPVVSNGKLTVTNVNVEGIAALILSADEITTLANQHLADAQQKINHPITAVQLRDKEVDLTLGQPGGGVTPPTLP